MTMQLRQWSAGLQTQEGSTSFNGQNEEGVPLSGFRVGGLLGGVYERVGKSVILVCKKAQRAKRCILLV